MRLDPPAHICGRIPASAPLARRRERYEWVCAASKAGYNNTQISLALGVSHNVAVSIMAKGEPQEWRPPVKVAPEAKPVPAAPKIEAVPYVGSAVALNTREAPVSLPPDPWGTRTMAPDARPETAPPRGIKSKRNGVTPEGFIALLRAECLRARMEA